jgi:hypothetical protein
VGPIAAAAWLVLTIGTDGAPAATSAPVTSVPDEAVPDEATPDEATPDDATPDEPAPDETEDTAPPDDVATPDPPAAAPTPAVAPVPEKKPDRYAEWEHRYGGFAELDLQLTTIDRSFATVLGGGVGFILVKRVIVGASGYGVVFHDRRYGSMAGDRQLRTAWGGPTIGVYAVRRRRVEASVNWLLAGGRACLNFSASDARCSESTGAFVNQVELNVYLKLAKILRLGFGLGYRFVSATRWDGPGNWSLSGGYGSFKIALGRF